MMRFLRIVLGVAASDPRMREEILADLDEGAADIAAQLGQDAARNWCLRQVVTSLPPLVIHSLRRASPQSWVWTCLAALGAYAAVIMLAIASSIIATLLFESSPRVGPEHFPAVALSLLAAGAAAGGFVAAQIGGHAPFTCAAVLGLLLVAIAAGNASPAPLWYHAVLLVSTVPAATLGAALRLFSAPPRTP